MLDKFDMQDMITDEQGDISRSFTNIDLSSANVAEFECYKR